MNRRMFLSLVPAIAVLPIVGTVAAHVPSMSLIRRKRLEADARVVSFTGAGGSLLRGPLLLRSKGNGLWITSVSWQDEVGAIHTQSIGKNLPRGQSLALPMIGKARNITFAVTCLPLASTATLVELVAA